MTSQGLVDELRRCFEPLELESFDGEFGFTDRCTSSITRVGYATNLSPAVVREAARQDLHALITHHDAWDFLYESRAKTYSALDKHGISHCFVHAPLDAAPFGTAATLAARLSLHVEGEFAAYQGLPCGRICTPASPASFQDLVSRFSRTTGAGIRVWKNHSWPIQRLGITTGGGSLTDLVNEASTHGCDTYITGESNLYTVQYALDRGLNLLIGTHTHPEFPGVEQLCSILQSSLDAVFIPIREPDIESGVLIQPDSH